MKKWISIILAFALAFSLAACGNSSDGTASTTGNTGAQGGAEASASETDSGADAGTGELNTIRLAVMTNNQSQWYALIGTETGIFADHGIQLEISEFAAGINTVDAIVTQQADIGLLADYAAINRIGNTAENSNIRYITRMATTDGKGATKLYVDPEQIQSLEDLAGVGFATLPGTVWDYWTAVTYEAAGVSEEDQNILNVDSAASAVTVLANGEGAAFWTSGTNAEKLVEAGFEPLLSLDDLDLHTDQYFVTSTEFLESDTPVIEEFIAALQDIVDWTEANQDEAASIIEAKTGYAAEQFLADYAAITLTIDFPQATVDHLNNIKAWAVDNGSFADYSLQDYIVLDPLKAALPDAEVFE